MRWGIHIAEESKNHGNTNEIWESTLATFAAKFVIAATFAVPVLFMPLDLAVVASLVWGVVAVGGAQLCAGARATGSALESDREHVVIGLCVVAITHYLGDWVRVTFG
jgi:VIT1/CCC1 family predicted Fe2+/Mn2+ transporter